ncbi:MAG: tripartite tricarboxylate transporter permease [Chloroflexi bacterium]|nr:tripartite tricarboxylate transporter permease [Chloroflexota bacterium]
MPDLALALKGVLDTFSPVVMLGIVLGTLGGLIFGVLPGIGAFPLMAVLLIFAFSMDPTLILSVLLAIHAVSVTGGSITSIVLGVPGTALNAATLLDGYPMAKKGEAARAIGAALNSSMLGGILGGIVLIGFIPIALVLVLAFGLGETFLIAVVGLAFISTLSGGSMIKGLISGGAGILLSFVGYQGMTALPRFTFGTLALYDGIGLIPFLMGIFALPEVIELALKKKAIASTGVNTNWAGVKQGVMDVFRHWKLFLRTSAIGTAIGIVPAVGGPAATFLAYGHAKQSSKHPENFGKGTVEGVIAPESANNSKEGGALVPTLAFGIPGSGGMVVLLSAFLAVGIIPGPSMLREHLDLSFTLVTTLILSNILAVIFLLPVIKYIARICLIPSTILVAPILVIVLWGAYASQNSYIAMLSTMAFGVLGFFMMKYDYNRVALILGFILGNIVEVNGFLAYTALGFSFLTRPIPIVLMVILVLVLFGGAMKSAVYKLRRI